MTTQKALPLQQKNLHAHFLFSELISGKKNALEAFKCLELQGLGDPSRTLEGNSRKRSESVSEVFPEFFRNFFRKVPQARKRHININFLVRLLLGHPGNVPGTNRVCPGDKVGLSQGQTQVFFLFYTAEAQFVPGTNPVCPWDIPGTKGGRQSLRVKSLCAFFVPYNFPQTYTYTF